MKLYDVPINTRIKIIGGVIAPPGSPNILEQEELIFKSLNGTYSYCTRDNGEVIHLAGWVNVEVLKQKK